MINTWVLQQHPVEGAKLIRKIHAPAKSKFFIWLVFHDRCWTTGLKKRHGLQDDDYCALCVQASETIDHLLITCSFSRELWFNLFCRIGWDAVSPSTNDQSLVVWWTSARKNIQKQDSQCFDKVVVLTCWMI